MTFVKFVAPKGAIFFWDVKSIFKIALLLLLPPLLLEIMVDVLSEFLFRHPLSPKRFYSVNQFLFVLRLHFRF